MRSILSWSKESVGSYKTLRANWQRPFPYIIDIFIFQLIHLMKSQKNYKKSHEKAILKSILSETGISLWCNYSIH